MDRWVVRFFATIVVKQACDKESRPAPCQAPVGGPHSIESGGSAAIPNSGIGTYAVVCSALTVDLKWYDPREPVGSFDVFWKRRTKYLS